MQKTQNDVSIDAIASGFQSGFGEMGGISICWENLAASGFRVGFGEMANISSRGGHVRAFTYNYVKTRPEYPAPHDLLSSGGNKVCFATTPPDMEASCKTKQQSGYTTRYTFSAKEKDDETQYSYFGARYYDSDLSVFLSVDNFSIKYPSLTPYHYCANNPINMIDINGDSLKLENAQTDGGDSRGDFTNYLAEKSGWNLTMKGDKVDFASKKDFKAARKEYRKGVGEFKSQLFEAITSDKDQKLKIGAGNNQVDMSSKDFIDFTDLQMAGETGFDLARVGASLEYSKTGDPFGNGPCNIEMKIMMEENMNFRQAIGSSDFRTRRDWSFDRRGSTVTRDNQLEYNYIWPGSIKSAYIIVSHDQNNGGSLSNVRFEIRKQ